MTNEANVASQKIVINDVEYDLNDFSNDQRLLWDRITFAQATIDVNSNAKIAMVNVLVETLTNAES